MRDDVPLEMAALNGPVIAWGVAEDISVRFGWLRKLLVDRRIVVDPRTVAIQRGLDELLARAGPRANASTRIGLEELPQAEGGLVDTTTAAQMLGVTTDAIRWHCRRGRFANVAIKRGRGWWIPVADVEAAARRNID